MKLLLRYIITITLALSVSWIMYIIAFQITEYVMQTERYNANGEPEFVMPTAAILNGFIVSIIAFISSTIWMNKIFAKKFNRN